MVALFLNREHRSCPIVRNDILFDSFCQRFVDYSFKLNDLFTFSELPEVPIPSGYVHCSNLAYHPSWLDMQLRRGVLPDPELFTFEMPPTFKCKSIVQAYT